MRHGWLLACMVVVLFSCTDPFSPYLVPQQEFRDELGELIPKAFEGTSDEARFVTNQRIVTLYRQSGAARRETLYLTSYVERYPKDRFNAYYLLLVANRYRNEGARPFAGYYYERIVKNHPDLLLDGRHSVHHMCLEHLIELVEEPEIRVGYYKELLSRFHDDVDRGRISYDLARTYEELGEWDLAMQFYREFLKFPDAGIPERPNARTEVARLVTLYDMPNKNWTFERLEDLITAIQRAIWSQNPRYLNSLRSRVGFFAKAWEDDSTDPAVALVSDLGEYLKNQIRVPGVLDRDSNEQEAYMVTYGWGFRIRTWYLYFRRLEFPADPSIHNQWEWAGIYLGEKPF